MPKKLLRWLLLILFVYVVYLWFFPNGLTFEKTEIDQTYYLGKLRANYAHEIEEVCAEYNLPAEYFKALAILECSAEKPPQSRFEPKVFERLNEVKMNKKPNYSNLKHPQLKNLTEEQLRDMATSWGVFQIMGYHAYSIGIAPRDLQGSDGLRQSIVWIDKSYGQYLRKRDFANALHLHNVGKPIPITGEYETYSPNYIPRGLEFIKHFETEKINKDNEKNQKTDSIQKNTPNKPQK
jgi:hypothetical protein